MPFYKEENRGSFLGREEFVCREAQGQRAEYQKDVLRYWNQIGLGSKACDSLADIKPCGNFLEQLMPLITCFALSFLI